MHILVPLFYTSPIYKINENSTSMISKHAYISLGLSIFSYRQLFKTLFGERVIIFSHNYFWLERYVQKTTHPNSRIIPIPDLSQFQFLLFKIWTKIVSRSGRTTKKINLFDQNIKIVNDNEISTYNNYGLLAHVCMPACLHVVPCLLVDSKLHVACCLSPYDPV